MATSFIDIYMARLDFWLLTGSLPMGVSK